MTRIGTEQLLMQPDLHYNSRSWADKQNHKPGHIRLWKRELASDCRPDEAPMPTCYRSRSRCGSALSA
jgi:hypothetical protein